MNTDRYSGRTVEWGHWGITFMGQQPDRSKNFGVIVAHLPFAVSSRGPVDGPAGSTLREDLRRACDEWVSIGALPARADLRAVTGQ